MNDKNRIKIIINYISSHQGCSTEQAFNGVKDHMGRGTFFKHLKRLKGQGQVRTEYPNNRDHGLYVNKDDPSVSVPEQLDKFEQALLPLYTKTSRIYEASLWQSDNKKATSPVALPSESISRDMVKMTVSILYRIVDSILYMALTVWPKIIQDRQKLKELIHEAFTKISDLILKLNERQDTTFTGINYFGDYQNLMILGRTGGAGFLADCLDLFQSAGLKDEVGTVLDAIWQIDKAIAKVIYRDPEIYKFEFDYKRDDWRKLIRLTMTEFKKKHKKNSKLKC